MSDLERIQGSIERLECTRTDLLRQLAELDKRLETERALYAQLRNQEVAIERLPNELLSMVFGGAHASLRTNRSGRADLDALRFLVDTSRVCVRWRQVVLHTPLLWNSIVMTVPPDFREHQEPQEYLEAHLKRSGDAFLDMTFFAETENPLDLDLFFTIIGLHAKRWRRVSIEMRSATIPSIQPHFKYLEVPMLKHFSINIWETRDGRGPMSPRTAYPDPKPQVFLDGAPNLSVLRLANAAIGHLHPNSTSITTLHLGGWEQAFFTWPQLKSLLESLPQLQNLSLHELCVRHNTRDPTHEPAPIHLPHLQNLRIHKPFTPVERFLPLFTVPKLERLALNEVENFDCTEIPSVTHLTMEGCPFDDPQFQNLISAFPNVQDLTIDASAYLFFDSDALSATTPTYPWRFLKTLTMRELTPGDVVPFTLMVLKRKRAEHPIETLRLDKRSRNVLRLKEKLETLNDHTKIVPFDERELWPPGRGYDDPHDLV
ncbi:hypothetical protein D9611_001919 [Ephemerocybe angulata]|uniref:F-box domain-containing protein n=1 Tax=Ephemerocybe angulata TaxID=980116 RepID=A0A8H5CJ44_9AGAR|nr:hypothetical protein D9611_001919 [Tulosesus angulatus]